MRRWPLNCTFELSPLSLRMAFLGSMLGILMEIFVENKVLVCPFALLRCSVPLSKTIPVFPHNFPRDSPTGLQFHNHDYCAIEVEFWTVSLTGLKIPRAPNSPQRESCAFIQGPPLWSLHEMW